MSTFRAIIAELVGMFFDDELLAFAILGVVALAAFLAFLVHASSILVGGVLLIGCVAVLVASARKGMTRR